MPYTDQGPITLPPMDIALPADGIPAVTYYRYSAHGQTEQSIEGQRTEAWKYAAAKGYNIVHEYVDRAMTGRNDDRMEFQRMISDTRRHKFKVIILWKVDRFGRNREEISYNKYRCKKNGVRVEYVAENIPKTPEGVILESVLEGFAEYFSLQLSQNVTRGLMESARRGQSTGHMPLGYRTDPETKHLVIDPDTAPTVKTIYTMYAAGKTCPEIVSHLNSKGLRTHLGRPFTKNSLRSILTNEKYIGNYRFGDIYLEGAVPAIIDPGTFAAVQKMLKSNKKAPSHAWTHTDYLLSDRLFCGRCGSLMIGESGHGKSGARYSYYLCGKHKRKQGCSMRAVRQAWIEQQVIDATCDLLKDDELLDFITDNTWEYYLAQDDRQTRIDSYKARLAAVKAGLDNLVKAVEAGLFTPALKARLDELEQERQTLEDALAEETAVKGNMLTKEAIRLFLYQFRDRDYTDREEQKRLVETFVNAVFVYDDKITITYNYGGDKRTITLREVDATPCPDVKDLESLPTEDTQGEVFDRCASRCTKKKDTRKRVFLFGFRSRWSLHPSAI